VEGGKAHEFVVELLSMSARDQCEADHGVLVNAHQPGRLADTTAIRQVSQDGERLVAGQAAIEQRRAFAFGEAFLTGATVEQACVVRAIVSTHREVVSPPLAVVGAVRVLAAEAAEVVHGQCRRIIEEAGELLTAARQDSTKPSGIQY